MNRYHIKRDGEIVATVNESDVMAWFHRNCVSSMNWAIKHEGYTVEDAGRAPDGFVIHLDGDPLNNDAENLRIVDHLPEKG